MSSLETWLSHRTKHQLRNKIFLFSRSSVCKTMSVRFRGTKPQLVSHLLDLANSSDAETYRRIFYDFLHHPRPAPLTPEMSNFSPRSSPTNSASTEECTFGTKTSNAAMSSSQLMKNSRKTDKPNLSCSLCLQNTVSVVMLPCGHICSCRSCAAKLVVSHNMQQTGTKVACPICRRPINCIRDVYFA